MTDQSNEREKEQEYDPSDLEGLQHHEMLHNGVEEWNTASSEDATRIIEVARDYGDRIEITAYVEEYGISFHVFDGGMSATEIIHQMDEMGKDLPEYIEWATNGDVPSDGITFWQLHESSDSSMLREEYGGLK